MRPSPQGWLLVSADPALLAARRRSTRAAARREPTPRGPIAPDRSRRDAPTIPWAQGLPEPLPKGSRRSGRRKRPSGSPKFPRTLRTSARSLRPPWPQASLFTPSFHFGRYLLLKAQATEYWGSTTLAT